MYIHLLPQLVETIGLKPVLNKITIPEFSFVLNNESFKTGTPYPNKRYLVGSFKQRKDGIGLLLKTEKNTDFFTTIYEWKSATTRKIITHTIKNFIIPSDEDLDMISQDIMLNIGMNDLKSRRHDDYKNMSPLDTQPTMHLDFRKLSEEQSKKKVERREPDSETINKISPVEFYVSERVDSIKLYTIESKRLRESFIYTGDRYPYLESAIEV